LALSDSGQSPEGQATLCYTEIGVKLKYLHIYNLLDF